MYSVMQSINLSLQIQHLHTHQMACHDYLTLSGTLKTGQIEICSLLKSVTRGADINF